MSSHLWSPRNGSIFYIFRKFFLFVGYDTAAGNFPFTYRGENEVLLGCFPEKLLIPSYGRHRDGFSMKSDVLKHRSVLTYYPCIVWEESDIKRNKLKVRKKMFKSRIETH